MQNSFRQFNRGTCNPNLHAAITHTSDIRSQNSFGLPTRMIGMHGM